MVSIWFLAPKTVLNFLSEIISPTFGWADDWGIGQNIKYKLLTTKRFNNEKVYFYCNAFGCIRNDSKGSGDGQVLLQGAN
jgi:hypothetical protein